MSKVTIGKFEKISALMTLASDPSEPVEVAIGDVVSNLELTNGDVIASCTVKGFTMKPIDVKRGEVTIYDNVPTYMSDPNGGQYRNFVQEAVEVRTLVVELPVDEADADEGDDSIEPVILNIPVEKIVSVNGGPIVDVTTPEELVEALANAEDNETIRFIEDITMNEAVNIDANNVTLNLEGNALAFETGAATRPLSISSGATVKIKGGTLSRDEAGSYGIVENAGELTLDNVTVTENGGDGGATLRNMSGGRMVINGGTFTNTGSSANQIFRNNQNATDTYLEVNNATLNTEGNRDYAIVVRSGEAVVNNTVVNGTHGALCIEAGKATITGGSYTAANFYGLYVSNAYGATEVEVNDGVFTGKISDLLATAPDGDQQGSLQKGNVNVTINGGTFPHKILLGNTENTKGYTWKLEAKGGTYGEDPSNYVPEGYEAVQKDGVWVVLPVNG